MLALAGFLAALSTAHAALVTFDYVGQPLTFIAGPYGDGVNRYGTNEIGRVYFDDTVVTADFTGTISTGYTALLGATVMGEAAAHGSFTFSQGQIVDWFLTSDYIRVVMYPVPVVSTTGSDYISPPSGGLYIGWANTYADSTPGGVWTREAVSPVPLPDSLPLLFAGAGLGAVLTHRRRSLRPS